MEVEPHTVLTSALDGEELLASQCTYYTTTQMFKKIYGHWSSDFWFIINFLLSIRKLAFVIQAISTEKIEPHPKKLRST